MNQQINLYQPIFRRQKKVFSAVTMLQICAFFIVVFAALYLYGEIKQQPLREQLGRLNADLVKLNAQLAQVEAKSSAASNSRLLGNEIAKLTRELEKRKQIQQMLSSQQGGNTRGLSAYLEVLARQHVQGMWLTGFTVGNGGRQLDLRGSALSPETVPVYLGRLAGEELLKGTSFNLMELTRPEPAAGHLDFIVGTNPPGGPKG